MIKISPRTPCNWRESVVSLPLPIEGAKNGFSVVKYENRVVRQIFLKLSG